MNDSLVYDIIKFQRYPYNVKSCDGILPYQYKRWYITFVLSMSVSDWMSTNPSHLIALQQIKLLISCQQKTSGTKSFCLVHQEVPLWQKLQLVNITLFLE